MKKIIFILFLFVILYPNKFFGQNLFCSFKSGYNYSTNGYYGIVDTMRMDSAGYYRSKKSKYLTLGKGFDFNFIFGYDFKNNISAEINFSYLKSDTIISHITQIYYTNITSLTYKYYSNSLRLIPTIGFNQNFNNFFSFIKFGCILGTTVLFYERHENNSSTTFNTQEEEAFEKWKYFNGISLGYNARLGIGYNLTDRISCLTEINMINFSAGNNKGELITYIEDGVDKLPTLSIYDKEIKFVKQLSYFPDQANITQPKFELKKYFLYNSIGVKFGIKIKF